MINFILVASVCSNAVKFTEAQGQVVDVRVCLLPNATSDEPSGCFDHKSVENENGISDEFRTTIYVLLLVQTHALTLLASRRLANIRPGSWYWAASSGAAAAVWSLHPVAHEQHTQIRWHRYVC